MRLAKSTAAFWVDSSVVRCMEATDYLATIEESKLRSTGSVRLDTGLANDGSVFLVVPHNQLAKLVAVAKVETKTQCRHALLDVGKLGGLARGLADARDDFRSHLGRRSNAKP